MLFKSSHFCIDKTSFLFLFLVQSVKVIIRPIVFSHCKSKQSNPLVRSPEQVKLDSDIVKIMNEFVYINLAFGQVGEKN